MPNIQLASVISCVVETGQIALTSLKPLLTNENISIKRGVYQFSKGLSIKNTKVDISI